MRINSWERPPKKKKSTAEFHTRAEMLGSKPLIETRLHPGEVDACHDG